jgi:MscS family membrane protein
MTDMKLKFERFYRGLLIFLIVCVAWGFWATAQTNTNQPAAEVKTNQTATLVKAMEQFDGRYLTFGLDRVPVLRETLVFGEPLWKYVASLIYLFLAFYVSKLIDLVAFASLRKLAARTETKLDDLLLELLHGPIKVLAFVFFLEIGLNIFDWSDRAKTYFSKASILVVAGSLTWLAIRIVELLLDFWRARHQQEGDKKFDEQLFSVIRKSLNIFIIIVAVMVTASNIGINITAAITSLSIGGLAVGLAAQDTLANLFGAVAVYADKPFRVGDQIKIDASEGTVEAVGMRSTRLRNPDGNLVVIPNKAVGNAAITNLSKRANIKTVMNLTLARNLPADKLKRALALLHEVYGKNPMTQDAWISFNQFTGGNLNIMVVHWWKGTDYQKYLAGMQEMNLAVKERFDAEKIEFA